MLIRVVPADPDWPRRFEEERAVLERVLAPWLHGGVHHIGSTSVPGLAAKPVLDMMAGVRDLERSRQAIPVLAGLFYLHAPHRPRALWFVKPSREAATHALHLTEPGSDLWRERLAFRDALRADPAVRRDYEQLKRRLAEAHRQDLDAYTAGKRAFVAAVLATAGVTLAPKQPPDR